VSVLSDTTEAPSCCAGADSGDIADIGSGDVDVSGHWSVLGVASFSFNSLLYMNYFFL
jgi:hypothetical protein